MEELKFVKTVISVVRFEVIPKLKLIVAVVERVVMELTRIERIQSSALIAIMAEKFVMIGMIEFAVVQSSEQIFELVDSMK
jgi:hypothetical protein